MHLATRPHTAETTIAFDASLLAKIYGVLCAGLLFVWPVVAGIPGIESRLLWLSIALPLLLLSFTLLTHALKGVGRLQWQLPPWSIRGGLVVLTGVILAYTTTIPPLAFSDELTIAIPGITVAYSIAAMMGWPILIALLLLGILGFLFFLPRWSHRAVLSIIFICWLVGVGVALTGIQSGLALRYPPVMHAMQVFSTILTAGVPTLLRTPNALWTILLGLTIWTLLPRWTTTAKIGIFAALMLGPLGWTYRIALYQACAELTIGLAAALLLWQLIEQRNRREIASITGAIFGLWFLTRPTSLAALTGSICLLVLLRRWKEIRWMLAVAAPLIIAWLALSPLFTAQYHLTSSGMLPTSLLPLWEALLALPKNFTPLGLVVLLLPSIILFFAGSPSQRLLLFSAWCIALPPALLQHLLAGSTFYGVGRYNVLLLLPEALAIGMLLMGTLRWKQMGKWLGAFCVLLLLWITPWHFASFLQELRASSDDIYRTPAEGYLPFALQPTLSDLLPTTKDTIVVLAPHYTVLDFFVATRVITLAERTFIIERSRDWSPASTARPVIIQAPTIASYQPNLTAEEEGRLRDARAWALDQPHQIVLYGTEETIIVP